MADTLLLADDGAGITALMRRYFEAAGYRVVCASSGREALERLSCRPDLILLDISMPDVDGLEVCRRIRSHVSCPILFLTARIETAGKVLGFQAGGDDYRVKPFDLDELGARVAAHLRRPDPGAGRAAAGGRPQRRATSDGRAARRPPASGGLPGPGGPGRSAGGLQIVLPAVVLAGSLLPAGRLFYRWKLKKPLERLQQTVDDLAGQFDLPQACIQYNDTLLDALGVSYRRNGASDAGGAGFPYLAAGPIPFSFDGEAYPGTQVEAGMRLTVSGVALTAAGISPARITPEGEGFFNGVQIIVSDGLFDRLTGLSGYNERYLTLAGEAGRAALETRLDALCAGSGGYWLSYENTDRQRAESYAQISLLCWGLILFIGAIGVLNIVNTVFTNIHTRLSEIGVQRAIGMSTGGLCRTFLWGAITAPPQPYWALPQATGAPSWYRPPSPIRCNGSPSPPSPCFSPPQRLCSPACWPPARPCAAWGEWTLRPSLQARNEKRGVFFKFPLAFSARFC